MKIRKGDRVAYWVGCTGPTYIDIVTSIRNWWLANGHIEVQGSIIVPRCNVIKIVQKREDIKEWWKYL